MSIVVKLSLVISILITVVSGIFVYQNIQSQKSILSQSLENRIKNIKSDLFLRAKNHVGVLANQIENDLSAFNLSNIQSTINSNVKNIEDIKYIMLVNHSKSIIFQTSYIDGIEQVDNNTDIVLQKDSFYSQEYDNILEVGVPVLVGLGKWGVLRIFYSLDEINTEIMATKQLVENSVNSVIENSIKITTFILVLFLIISYFISRRIALPILTLTKESKKVAGGDFDIDLPEDDKVSKDEIGMLFVSFKMMVINLKDSYKRLENYSSNLEQMVELRTKELEETHKEIESSIDYASKIQMSMLSDETIIKNFFKDSFVIWLARNKVSGDLYIYEECDDGVLCGVMDCTGHGVPGGFMTMLAGSTIKQLKDKHIYNNPAQVLFEMNNIIKNHLKQHNRKSTSDDGLDIGLCFIDKIKNKLIYSGAKIDLIYFGQDGMSKIKSNRQSIGYRRSKLDYVYDNHTIDIEIGDKFYLYSDGIIDQVGEKSVYPYGNKKFINLLSNIQSKSMEAQRGSIIKELYEYQGNSERRDDITVIGFEVK
jgi:serine phosphatase RsbU (regulator of sigma subunit)/HAMP domain-containing protein